eukprot:TRINITY_DN19010_c0_g1_i1.p1 TRINITY_DN19010_c0_g1~~TRINITY_DN19010_c0_g1_i1.p1  ORF type:complete len:605 (+),score=124.40 TRINITY_DN19010_c0_g1_i1:77-1891(+)
MCSLPLCNHHRGCSDESDDSEEDDEGTTDSDYSELESSLEACLKKWTTVPHDMFDHPVVLGVSGGTAAFFALKYAGPKSGPSKDKYGRSPTYWIGKDLARAMDEVDFYEKIGTLDKQAYRLLHNWAFDYAGVLKKKCMLSKATLKGKTMEPDPREMLVLRNLRDGRSSTRLMDIKIGRETAVAGWHGKSWWRATKQRWLTDRVTMSDWAGFRLEGFDSPPECLRTQLEGSPSGCCQKISKKHRRLILQRQHASEFLGYFVDFCELRSQITDTRALLTPLEMSEATLYDAIRKMACMCGDAEAIPVPQMWIGSSLALICDGSRLLSRDKTLEMLRSKFDALTADPLNTIADVSIFDWGRSECVTQGDYDELAPKGQVSKESYKRYWAQWRSGVLRVLFDAVQLYLSKFAIPLAAPSQPSLFVEIWDYDTHDPSDLMATTRLPLEDTNGPMEVELDPGTITLEIFSSPPPANSRLIRQWHVIVHNVCGLPSGDLCSPSDMMVALTVELAGYNVGGTCMTPVIWNQNDADFDYQLDFGEARPEVVARLFEEVGGQFAQKMDRGTFQDTFEDFLESVETLRPLRSYVNRSNTAEERKHRKQSEGCSVA